MHTAQYIASKAYGACTRYNDTVFAYRLTVFGVTTGVLVVDLVALNAT
jgi:hypothetical protein